MKDGKTIGQWLKWDFEKNGILEIRDKNNNELYIEFPHAFWAKSEFDSKSDRTYYENSYGEIEDNRPPEVITHTNGRKYKLIP